MEVASRMRQKLMDALNPTYLDIEDQSQRHVGHAGYDPRGETHFKVTIVSPAFTGRSRVDRQRMVYGVLAEELAGRVHALQLVSKTPDEAAP